MPFATAPVDKGKFQLIGGMPIFSWNPKYFCDDKLNNSTNRGLIKLMLHNHVFAKLPTLLISSTQSKGQ
jgi:hypothetical protein